jgi:Kef-type K+ transport system membrane component KefB/mannitol/fructose-specific phosphotransferase system IIA component (Ntr-type)
VNVALSSLSGLSSAEGAALLFGIGLLVASARVLGELARRLRQPAIVGEILAGVLLGPTVLGRLWPEVGGRLFPAEGTLATVLQSLATVAITLFLLVAGLEVTLSTLWRRGRAALSVGLFGILVPFAVGLTVAWWAPGWLGGVGTTQHLPFALFMATALSISALPVIARTLMDLGLYRTDLGVLIVAAAVFNDLVGWFVFALVLGMLDHGQASGERLPLAYTFGLVLTFALSLLTFGRRWIHRGLPWIERRSLRPGGVLSFALTAALICAAFTEWVGVHAVFGSFLFGVAIGDSSHLRERTRATMEQFISLFFAPLFFASIGLRVDFLAHLDLGLVLVVLGIAVFGKVLGGGLGGRLGGLSWNESWAVGFGLNARGAMEIVLGLLALENGLIGAELFVALVVMALVTSMMSGPMIQVLIGRRRSTPRFTDRLRSDGFVRPLRAANRFAAIEKLVDVAARVHGFDRVAVTEAVLARERSLSTGLPNGVAIPHARIEGLAQPIVAVGVSPEGLDFDTPDGALTRLVVLSLTPADNTRAQLEVLADVARTFRDPGTAQRAAAAEEFSEFLEFVQAQRGLDAAD